MYKIGLIVVCLYSAIGWSQTKENDHQNEVFIKGQVVTVNEIGEQEGVPGAKLYWNKDRNKTITKSDGTFEIRVQKFPDTLYARSVGFKTIAYLVNDPSIYYTINLKEGMVLNGVVVMARDLGKSMDLRSPTNIERIGEGELRKAACCNLSESFETNASVDVNITDAVSGAKKIQMLGLDGVYTQLQWENIPLVRGLSTSYGLAFTPGTWIESIQITKGTGSVVNGYESMAGMINLELKKPTESEQLYVNLYGNRFTRGEVNIHGAQKINDKWSTMSFVHASNQFQETDVNSDGFRDMPIGFIGAAMHRWSYNLKNIEGKFGFKGTFADKQGGQLGSTPSEDGSSLWNASFETKHLEVFAKNGIFLKNRKNGSIGLIAQAKYHEMSNRFGASSYNATQRKFYFNSIYGDIIGNTNHNIKTGFSFLYDDYDEVYDNLGVEKTEIVPGVYGEYTYNRLDKLIVVAGIRADQHNMFGPLITPRLHAKWNISKRNALRVSAGRGYRVPNTYADYNSLMASNRIWIFDPTSVVPEDGISLGVTFTQRFLLNDRPATFTTDYFYTHFLNQLIVDMDIDPNEVHIYNTNTTSFSHSFQTEVSIEPIKGLELRGAFKYYDVRATFANELVQRAFVPKYRVLLNGGYTTRNKKWSLDVTGNFVGQKRLPSTASNPVEFQRPTTSESFWIINSQFTYNLKHFSIYLGGENLLNVIQDNAIISAEDPFGAYFDATQIWAPVSGANIYAGVHFAIKQKKSK